MHTRPYLLYAHRDHHSRLAAALSCLLAVCMLAGCAAPRRAGRAESEQRLSPCESAVEAASADAERAGFATDVLAGRFVSGVARDARTTPLAEDGTLLAMSENHKQTASQMMQLSNGARDLRQKMYGTDELLAHSANVTYTVNGFRATTVAVWRATRGPHRSPKTAHFSR